VASAVQTQYLAYQSGQENQATYLTNIEQINAAVDYARAHNEPITQDFILNYIKNTINHTTDIFSSITGPSYPKANSWSEGKPQAAGGDYIVSGPTTFLAGEAGPERATFTPLGTGGGSAGTGTEIHVHYHAPMVSMSDEARLKERLGPIIDQLIQKYKGRL
jgi:hypothetical protein